MAKLSLDATMGNIKNFISSVVGVPMENVDGTSVEYAISTDNPAKGRIVNLKVTGIKTKAGSDFSKHVWAKHDPNQPKLVRRTSPQTVAPTNHVAQTPPPENTAQPKQSVW